MSHVLSKVLSNEFSLPYNCYEVSHTWTPNCSNAAFEVGFDVFKESLKMYSTLYLASQLIANKCDQNSFYKTALKILRSSVFLGTNAFTAFYFMCLNRRLSGKFYFFLCSHLPAFLSSFLAICIEAKHRRQTLALYVLNIASETVYRSLIDKGYLKSIPNGEVFLFAVSVSIILYLSENKSNARKDFISKALMFIIDEQSTKKCIETTDTSLHSYLKQLLKPFFVGFFAKYALSTFTSPQKLLNKPSLAILNLFSKENLKFALFLTSFKCVYHTTKFLLQKLNKTTSKWHSLLSGFTAGLTMFIHPHSSMSLYMLWKGIELLYLEAVSSHIIKHSNLTISFLYAIATSQLFYCAIHEPKSMKRSYMKFLDKLTHEKLHLVNRNLLEAFGTSSSFGFKSDFPKLDMQHTSRQYKETIFLWLIS
ncbi:hypothetical protein B4U80_00586 [Leptotrombidium deliense]|uniref:Transmembrane protein 135 N-terminal domain-containing protein n=1 Tax=Leptotrombidium deliense TaxID=299467 RepID=A0A443SMC5_9ACAR|nr:hypothetical protein B4U80_00586 [Leptotrombidium deliense]